jgi:hypothetical protein
MTVAHVVIGVMSIASAHSVLDVGAYSIATILISIVYVSWFGRRVAGVAVAAGVGMFEILSQQPAQLLSFVWAGGYLMLAWIVSSIERATRPPTMKERAPDVRVNFVDDRRAAPAEIQDVPDERRFSEAGGSRR